jgi:redox-sensitive bicupin YhaK (pirin superfamily)
MIRIRKAEDRGHADHGWLQTSHTFSFAGYRDPQHMGFRSLRVMNEDRVQPGQGFGTHGHDNMEIISVVLSGQLQHRDSMGNGAVLRPGELQRISAGSGINHSEFNPSASEPVHFYQIWIQPDVRDTEPQYEQKAFDYREHPGQLRLVASPDGRDGSLGLRQDARIYLTRLNDQDMRHQLAPGRHAWVQVLSGKLAVNGHPLDRSDGAAISGETLLEIAGQPDADFLLFDLP